MPRCYGALYSMKGLEKPNVPLHGNRSQARPAPVSLRRGGSPSLLFEQYTSTIQNSQDALRAGLFLRAPLSAVTFLCQQAHWPSAQRCHPFLTVLRDHSWWALGTLWDAGDRPLISHVQGKCLSHCTISPAQQWPLLFLSKDLRNLPGVTGQRLAEETQVMMEVLGPGAEPPKRAPSTFYSLAPSLQKAEVREPLFPLVLGCHTQHCSGLISGSAHRNHSWPSSGDPMGSWGLNLGQPIAKQNAYPLAVLYHSGPSTIV